MPALSHFRRSLGRSAWRQQAITTNTLNSNRNLKQSDTTYGATRTTRQTARLLRSDLVFSYILDPCIQTRINDDDIVHA